MNALEFSATCLVFITMNIPETKNWKKLDAGNLATCEKPCVQKNNSSFRNFKNNAYIDMKQGITST